jgi:hypothetical protein
LSPTVVRASTLVCLAVALVAAAPARAEDARAAAHEHFDRGMAASNDQRFAEAVTEFERAYALWPDYRVLYNIGKVRATLGRSAESVAAFEGYLEKGGAELSDERKQEVRDAMAAQLAHVGALDVRVSADGAEVRVDGKLLGRSPLAAPVRLTEGKHTVEAILPGRPSQLREVELPGASKLAIDLAFPTPPVALSPAAAPVVVGNAASPDPRRKWRLVGFGVAGAGAVAAVAGAIVAYRAATDANAARALMVEASMPSAPATPDLMKYDAAKRDYDSARTRNQLGWALVGVGATAVAGGLTIAILPGGLSFGGTW